MSKRSENTNIGLMLGAILGFLIGRLPGLIIGAVIGYLYDSRHRSLVSKSWGAAIGLMLGGPLGAIAGVYLGGLIKEENPERHINKRDVLHIHMVALMACIVKADGRIAKEEIQLVVNVLRNMGYSIAEMQRLQRAFQQALEQDVDLTSTCQTCVKMTNYYERLALYKILLAVAAADGEIHSRERDVLKVVKQLFLISDSDYNSMWSEYEKQDDDYHYKVLGLEPGVTKQQVKKAYRNLALKHHPDRVAHLGPEYQEQSKRKFQEIVNSYEKVIKDLS